MDITKRLQAKPPKPKRLRFKCWKCERRGHTLLEQKDGSFRCYCGNKAAKGFWEKKFIGVPDELTLRQASQVLGSTDNGSTLRRAIIRGDLTPARAGERGAQIITRDELKRFYSEKYNRRRWNGRSTTRSQAPAGASD